MSFFDYVKFSVPDVANFPATRYHGSKRKLLAFLHERLAALTFTTALDLFSGSASVSLLMRQMNKQVSANDYLPYNQNTASLFLNLASNQLPSLSIVEEELRSLLTGSLHDEPLVETGFAGIYFTDEENQEIDRFCQNLHSVSELRRSLYIYAVGQALLMKRPFGLFHRRNLNLRMADVDRTFGNGATWNRPILDHAIAVINELRNIGWHGPAGSAHLVNTAGDLDALGQHDLIYIDPPYIGQEVRALDYAGVYHFLTGLVDYPAFGRGDLSKRHAPILNLPSNWKQPASATAELCRYVVTWPDSILALSYRSDGRPSLDELVSILSDHGRRCEVHTRDFQYALSPRQVGELLLVSLPF